LKLISLADLKAFIGEDSIGTGKDALLTAIIEYVSPRIESYLNRNLRKETRRTLFNAGKKIFALSAYPIDSSTTAVSVVLDGTTQTINSDYFVWEDRGVVEFEYTPLYTEPQQIAITWVGGYTEISDVIEVPDDIKLACVLQCSYVFRRRKDIGATSISMPDGSVSSAGSMQLLPEVKDILGAYKRLLI
jgi:hypothetical protein